MKTSLTNNRNTSKLISHFLQQNPCLDMRLPVDLFAYVRTYLETNSRIDLNILLNIYATLQNQKIGRASCRERVSSPV